MKETVQPDGSRWPPTRMIDLELERAKSQLWTDLLDRAMTRSEICQYNRCGHPRSAHLDTGCEGIHHVRYRIDDLDSILEAVEDEGYDAIWHHDMGFAKWAYVEHRDHKGVVLEFLQM